MSASTRRHDLLRTRLDRFTRTLHGVESAEPRDVHRVRVASRRLRELLPVLQLDPAVSRKLGRRLRNVRRVLGPIREADVMAGLVHELAERGTLPAGGSTAARLRRRSSLPVEAERQAWRSVAAGLRRRREEALREVSPREVFGELKRIGRKLEQVAESLDREDEGHGRRGWHWALDARIARRATLLDAALRDAGAVYLPERLHAVRIAVKKLRYAVELAVEARGARASAELRTLKRVQDGLGQLRDLQLLAGRMRELEALPARPDLASWRALDRLAIALEHDCRRLHGTFVKQRRALAALAEQLAGQKTSAVRASRRAG